MRSFCRTSFGVLPRARGLGVPLVLASSSADAATATAHAPARHHVHVFPANNYWNADISGLPVEAHSRTGCRTCTRPPELHPDFGPSYGDQPVPYGIPITVVSGTHAKVWCPSPILGERPGEVPLGSDTKIEGGAGRRGDRHAISSTRAPAVSTRPCRPQASSGPGTPARGRRGR